MSTYQQFAPLADWRALFQVLVLALVAAEVVWITRRRGQRYDAGAAFASLGVAVGHFASAALTAAFTAPVFGAAAQLARWQFPLDDAWTWIGGFFAVEFAYYWFHRWSHQVRWFWASHAVHHSAEQLALPAAIRLGWTGLISGAWLCFVPLVLLGWPPLAVAVLLGLNLQFQFLLHTEAVGKLGVLEWVLNTPSHHRVHHASNPRYLDRNFGGVLIVYDRLFGTLALEDPADPPRYGLTHPLRSRNPVRLALGEWLRMARELRQVAAPRDAWRILFGRPPA